MNAVSDTPSAPSSKKWGDALLLAATICLILLILRVCANQVTHVMPIFIYPDVDVGEQLRDIAYQLSFDLQQILLIPGFMALTALGRRYRSGEIFSAANAALIQRFGMILILSFFAGTIIRPNLMNWIGGHDDRLPYMIHDPNFVIGAIGVLVVIIAGAMQEAVRLKEENESFI